MNVQALLQRLLPGLLPSCTSSELLNSNSPFPRQFNKVIGLLRLAWIICRIQVGDNPWARSSASIPPLRSVKQAVQNGLGIAFISAFAVETELKANLLLAIKVKNLGIRRDLKIVYRKDKHLSIAAKAFVEVSRAWELTEKPQ